MSTFPVSTINKRNQTLNVSKNNVLEKIFDLIATSKSPDRTLDEVVRCVAEAYKINVCSVYVLEPKKKELVLRATVGLSKNSVDIINMKVNEGLTGLVLETLKPLFVIDPSSHPRYKYYENSGEEIYKTFLGLPLIYHQKVLGVMVIQTVEKNTIKKSDVPMFSSLSTQIAATVAYTGLLENLKSQKAPASEKSVETERNFIQGTSVGGSFARGHAYYLKSSIGFDQIKEKQPIHSGDEIKRLESAFLKSIDDIKKIIMKTNASMGEENAILEAHLMYLNDKSFKNRMIDNIKKGNSAENALKKEIFSKIEFFEGLEDPYLRDRGSDIENIGKKILGHLMNDTTPDMKQFDKDTILMASDLSPVDLINLNQKNLKGIILVKGGKTSHTVILAKSFEIPIIIGVAGLLQVIRQNDFIIMDASSGIIFKNPPLEIQQEYDRIEKEKNEAFNRLNKLKDKPAITKDGHTIGLGANIGLMSDMDLMKKYGADFVGLYRTEFPFLIRKNFPTENEQFDIYSKILKKAAGKEVTIRTIDVGGDKLLPYLDCPKEENPFLGWRSIRISLDMENIFREQIRAILRASAKGKVKILFPMISAVSELKKIIRILEEEKQTLKERNIPVSTNIKIGIMVEVPAAALIINRLVEYVDFVSIGTNDLVQYLLAVDRNNEKIAHLYTPFHPAVLSTVHKIILKCNHKKIPVCICGEAATNKQFVALLIAMGAKLLSMNSGSIPFVKNFIRGLNKHELDAILKTALSKETSEDIIEFLSTSKYLN